MGGGIRIQFPLRPWQVEARRLRDERSLVVINGGVHTGKTFWAAAELFQDMLTHPNETFWWVAGQRFQLEAMWNVLRPYFLHVKARVKQHPLLFAEMLNGARMYGVSAENLDAIASHHPRAIYGDEVAKWRLQAWHLVRLRLLGQGRTRGLFLSTPRPNFWRDMVRWGRDAKDGRWGLIHITTPDAGLISPEAIEAIRHDLPDELFRQEVMAEVLEGSGNVFRNVLELATGQVDQATRYYSCTIGYDPAKLRDFAVVLVRHKDQVVWVERWARVEYTEQVRRVAELSKRFGGARVVIDAGGPGEAAAELLTQAKVPIERVVFTNDLKEQLVNKAMVRFEQKKIVLPHPSNGIQYRALVDELTAFERCRTDSGLHYTYSAPEGEHDDCVTALLLAFGYERTEPGILVYYQRLAEQQRMHWIRTDYGD